VNSPRIDGMQEVRGSNPLSSTSHNAPTAPALAVVCQQIVSRSPAASARTLLALAELTASRSLYGVGHTGEADQVPVDANRPFPN
jgi:hypothetical protein